jgi:hypothetical protein
MPIELRGPCHAALLNHDIRGHDSLIDFEDIGTGRRDGRTQPVVICLAGSSKFGFAWMITMAAR